MSYILSALKKADQERQSGQRPHFVTDNSHLSAMTQSTNHPWQYWLVVGMLALIAVNIGGYQWMNRSASLPQPLHPASQSEEAPTAALDLRDLEPPKKISTTPIPSARPAASDTPALPPAVGEGDIFSPPVMEESETLPAPVQTVNQLIPELMGLADNVRNSLPTLELTGHLYSLAHPKARKVIINGRSLREQQYLNNSLSVSEITPEGAVLSFQGHLFKINTSQMFQ